MAACSSAYKLRAISAGAGDGPAGGAAGEESRRTAARSRSTACSSARQRSARRTRSSSASRAFVRHSVTTHCNCDIHRRWQWQWQVRATVRRFHCNSQSDTVTGRAFSDMDALHFGELLALHVGVANGARVLLEHLPALHHYVLPAGTEHKIRVQNALLANDCSTATVQLQQQLQCERRASASACACVTIRITNSNWHLHFA